MNAIVERKFYVLSGKLQAILLAESARQAAIIAVEKFGNGITLAPYIAVNEAGFESLRYHTYGDRRGGENFDTAEILDNV